MKIRKFDKYVELLDDCLSQVNQARTEGVMLTDTEMLDYSFKYSLSTGKSMKGDVGFLGAFYAEYLEEVYDFRTMGYSNKEMLSFLKRVCFRGRALGISRVRVSGKDENGVFYLNVKNCCTKEEVEIPVTGIKSFTQACLAVITLVATDGLNNGEFKSFAEEYLLNVYKEIQSGKNPKPYIYTGVSKSLKTYMSKGKTEKHGNIVQFRVG